MNRTTKRIFVIVLTLIVTICCQAADTVWMTIDELGHVKQKTVNDAYSGKRKKLRADGWLPENEFQKIYSKMVMEKKAEADKDRAALIAAAQLINQPQRVEVVVVASNAVQQAEVKQIPTKREPPKQVLSVSFGDSDDALKKRLAELNERSIILDKRKTNLDNLKLCESRRYSAITNELADVKRRILTIEMQLGIDKTTQLSRGALKSNK